MIKDNNYNFGSCSGYVTVLQTIKQWRILLTKGINIKCECNDYYHVRLYFDGCLYCEVCKEEIYK